MNPKLKETIKRTKKHYAQNLILVNSILVNFFRCLVITRNHTGIYGRNLVEIDPTSLPHLSKQLRDLKNRQKRE